MRTADAGRAPAATAADPLDGRQSSDLTGRARIRDAAIDCFAEGGFGASFRTVAARAGVSPGLITHHFRSKSALRAECDSEVLRRYRTTKADAIGHPSLSLVRGLGDPQWATVLVYMLRAISSGGDPGREFLDRLIDDARAVMVQGVESGLIRPSRDEEARLRYLAHQSIGAMLVRFVTMPGATPQEFMASLHAGTQDSILPALELFCEGLFTDRRLLDEYLVYTSDPPRPGDGSGTPEASP